MEITIHQTASAVVEATVAFESAQWKQYLDKAYEKLAENVEIQGFRKGKAPLNLAKGRINPEKAINEAINSILNVGFKAIQDEHHYDVMLRPDVKVNKVSDEELEVTFTLTLRPEVKLGNYRGIEIKKEAIEVSDVELNQELLRIQQQSAEVAEKESGVVEMGDLVNFDFEGFIDGVAFEGGKAEKFDLEIGSNQFVPGFEQQMIGLKKGEASDVTITFPENYVKELAGKTAVFKVLIHEVKVKTLPAINDDLALDANIEGVSDLAGLKVHLTKTITDRNSQEAQKAAFNQLVDQIVANSTLELPQPLIDEEVNHSFEHFKEDVEKNKGIPFDKYCEVTGQTEESIKQELVKDVKRNLNSMFVLSEIAKENDIKVEDADVEAEYTAIAAQYGISTEEVKKALQEHASEVSNQIFSRKIGEFITSINQIQ